MVMAVAMVWCTLLHVTELKDILIDQQQGGPSQQKI